MLVIYKKIVTSYMCGWMIFLQSTSWSCLVLIWLDVLLFLKNTSQIEISDIGYCRIHITVHFIILITSGYHILNNEPILVQWTIHKQVLMIEELLSLFFMRAQFLYSIMLRQWIIDYTAAKTCAKELRYAKSLQG